MENEKQVGKIEVGALLQTLLVLHLLLRPGPKILLQQHGLCLQENPGWRCRFFWMNGAWG